MRIINNNRRINGELIILFGKVLLEGYECMVNSSIFIKQKPKTKKQDCFSEIPFSSEWLTEFPIILED